MNWTDISIGQFNDLKDIATDPEYSHEDIMLFEIRLLFGKDPSKMKVAELTRYIKELDFLSTSIPTMKVREKYKLGETKYRLCKELPEITVAQWIDWQQFLKEGTDSDNFSRLLSVFFIPEDCKEYGEGYDVKKVRQEINDHLSVADAMSISAFFLNFQRASLIASLLYTRKLTMESLKDRKARRKVRKEYRKALWAIMTGD